MFSIVHVFLCFVQPVETYIVLGFLKINMFLSNILSNTWVSIYEHEYVKKHQQNTFNRSSSNLF